MRFQFCFAVITITVYYIHVNTFSYFFLHNCFWILYILFVNIHFTVVFFVVEVFLLLMSVFSFGYKSNYYVIITIVKIIILIMYIIAHFWEILFYKYIPNVVLFIDFLAERSTLVWRAVLTCVRVLKVGLIMSMEKIMWFFCLFTFIDTEIGYYTHYYL